VFQSTTWWLDFGANVHVCSYYVARDSSMMVENRLHDSVYDIGTIDIKLTSKKNHATEEHATCPFYQ
jgi:hypothetical protein